jgi:hypothetical protein
MVVVTTLAPFLIDWQRLNAGCNSHVTIAPPNFHAGFRRRLKLLDGFVV